MAKQYKQYCGIAKAFEVLGERWTPLVVRELMLGSRRFSDLLEGLPGVGSSTLADRIKHLEREAIVARRELPPPAASAVYELTESGRALARAIIPLAMWGSRRLPPPSEMEEGTHCQSRWLLNSLLFTFDPELARGLTESYELRVGKEVFRAEVRDGELDLQQALEPRPADLVATMSPDTLMDGMTGRRTLDQLLASGAVQIQASADAFQRFLRLFLPPWLQELRAKI